MIKLGEQHIILGQQTDEKGFDVARWVFELLVRAYPSYSWHVVEQDGLLVIKELGLSAIFGPYGMALRNYKSYSVSQLKHDVIVNAGELLERAGLPRGHWDGQMPELEGASTRFRRPMPRH
jgi:hypothetical protein